MSAPETLRTFAEIFEKPSRASNGKLYPPTEIELVAAHALRFTAAAIEAGITAVDPDRQPDAKLKRGKKNCPDCSDNGCCGISADQWFCTDGRNCELATDNSSAKSPR